jgi:2'-5' RNA ligase
MPRLFVAVDLPDAVKAELVRLQPPSGNGVRCTPPDQMHLTLHFLGDVDLDPVVEALQRVKAASFSLRLEGVGTFGSAGRGFILWAGFGYCPAVLALHAAIADALQQTGYQPERRPFSPHLTLARCKPRTPRSVIDDFLRRHANFRSADFPIRQFALYSSTLTPDGAEYRREAHFPLGGDACSSD